MEQEILLGIFLMPSTILEGDTTDEGDAPSVAADPRDGHRAQHFAVDTATQNDEFDYRCNSKSFGKDYFEHDEDKTRLYTGLPSFEILEKTLRFVAPFVDRRSTTLDIIQEFILVLMKLKINVHQDLAYQFEIVCTVFRIMSDCHGISVRHSIHGQEEEAS